MRTTDALYLLQLGVNELPKHFVHMTPAEQIVVAQQLRKIQGFVSPEQVKKAEEIFGKE